MKEPLLLIPGMMCDARLFGPQIAAFSVSRPVMTVPLIGKNSFEELAADILVHAPQRFALAGLSMGGIAAMEIIRQAPDRVTRLALMDTNPLAELPERAKEREPQIKRVRTDGLRSVMCDEMKPNYLTDGSNKQSVLDLCMVMAEDLGEKVFEAQSRALQQRRDQCDTLRRVDVPAWVICGEDDQLCPVERHKMMRDLIPGAQLTVIANAGHLPVLEQPEQTNGVLDRWLNL